jgi:hypothetical protein
MTDVNIYYFMIVAGTIGLLASEKLAKGRVNSYHSVDKNSDEYKKALKQFRIMSYLVSLFLIILGLVNIIKNL